MKSITNQNSQTRDQDPLITQTQAGEERMREQEAKDFQYWLSEYRKLAYAPGRHGTMNYVESLIVKMMEYYTITQQDIDEKIGELFLSLYEAGGEFVAGCDTVRLIQELHKIINKQQ